MQHVIRTTFEHKNYYEHILHQPDYSVQYCSTVVQNSIFIFLGAHCANILQVHAVLEWLL